jgi:hypothetical protein
MSFNSFYYKNYLSKIIQKHSVHARVEKKFIVERELKPGLFSGKVETVSCGSDKLNRVLSERNRVKGVGFYLHSDKLIGGHNKYKSIQLSFLSPKSTVVRHSNKTFSFLDSLARFPGLAKTNRVLSTVFKRTKAGFIMYSNGFTGFFYKRKFRNLLSQTKKACLASKETRAQLILILIGRVRSLRINFGSVIVKQGRMCINYNFINKKLGSKFRRRSFQTKRFRFTFGSKIKRRPKLETGILKIKRALRKKN